MRGSTVRTVLLALACLAAQSVAAHHDLARTAPHEPDRTAVEQRARAAAAQHYFTDRRLLTQDGNEVSFYSDVLKDNVVLVNFVFTQCPDACPVQSAKMAEVQRLLAGFASDRLRLVSVATVREKVRAINLGGRAHTFTEVASFGGGFVPPLNEGLTSAPECPAPSVEVIPPGEQTILRNLAAGNHRFQCCIHPWMRALVKVEPR